VITTCNSAAWPIKLMQNPMRADSADW